MTMQPAWIRANSVNRALEIIGDRWVIMLLQQAFVGVRRFEDFQRLLGIARSTLASRLRHLVAHGLFERRPTDAHSRRHEYRLTEKGRDLFATALMAEAWQQRWAAPPDHRQVLLHRECNHATHPQLVCGSCRKPLLAREVRYADGPGASWVQRAERRRRRSSLEPAPPPRVPVSPDLLELLGDRWTPQVAAVGFFGVRRFEDMRASLQLATNILADRLRRLVELDVFRTERYQARPARYEYRLTEKGLALYPILIALMAWGDRWCAAAEGPPLLLTHRPCGSPVVPELVCNHCGGAVTPDNVGPRRAPRTARRFPPATR